jgi:hypothetical protein
MQTQGYACSLVEYHFITHVEFPIDNCSLADRQYQQTQRRAEDMIKHAGHMHAAFYWI